MNFKRSLKKKHVSPALMEAAVQMYEAVFGDGDDHGSDYTYDVIGSPDQRGYSYVTVNDIIDLAMSGKVVEVLDGYGVVEFEDDSRYHVKVDNGTISIQSLGDPFDFDIMGELQTETDTPVSEELLGSLQMVNDSEITGPINSENMSQYVPIVKYLIMPGTDKFYAKVVQ